ncbi:Uncharacterized protein FWK35_00033626 [Aphis craccivora]|uniref:Uncharacterized protein n=1 Tax=Aphis craccivora TaxID=307492 RepID=A0A6G0VLZ2_APHCR|nr:Uncharacterized protein FWK35_00033626 [Aphis craccivora]
MMCVFFFVPVYNITSRNNAPISNLRGGFRYKSEYPWYIIQVKSNYFQQFSKKSRKTKKKKSGKVGTALLYIRCRVDHYYIL